MVEPVAFALRTQLFKSFKLLKSSQTKFARLNNTFLI
jgi:hypothetical protein